MGGEGPRTSDDKKRGSRMIKKRASDDSKGASFDEREGLGS